MAHTHSHSDHTAGDRQFAARPGTTLVEASVEAMKPFFGITSWPEQTVGYKLGGRTLDIIPIPGHDVSSIAVYDRQTRVLLTGDSLYPGRVYVNGDPKVFKASNQRLVDFAADHVITFILGTHIEQTRTPFVDYPVGTVYQPDEHVLELGVGHLLELNDALRAMGEGLRRTGSRSSRFAVATRPARRSGSRPSPRAYRGLVGTFVAAVTEVGRGVRGRDPVERGAERPL